MAALLKFGDLHQPGEDQFMQLVCDLLRKKVDVDLSQYKSAPVQGRLKARLNKLRISSYTKYLELLDTDPLEVEALLRYIPLHVTSFFRDLETWQLVQTEVIDSLLANAREGDVLRCWSAGCATGEEAYTIAMLMAETTDLARSHQNFQVFATDASPQIVAKARRGEFSKEVVANISPGRLAQFFDPVGNSYRVKRHLRQKLAFGSHDLVNDSFLGGIDFISCRNVLIYLDAIAAPRVTNLLLNALKTGGYLLLGISETLSPCPVGIERISPLLPLYRRTGPMSGTTEPFTRRTQGVDQAGGPDALDRFMAIEARDVPSLLVDKELKILRLHGDVRSLLMLPSTPPPYDLRLVAQPDHVATLVDVTQKALAGGGKTFVATSLSDPRAPGQSLSVRVIPVHLRQHAADGVLLISFIPESVTKASTHGAPGAPSPMSEARWTSPDDVEASREEAQVLYEELKATNEQLQAINEELNDKISEINQQNDILAVGAVRTIFLDRELRIQWFTPAASDLIPVMKQDIGRQVSDLSLLFEDPGFSADLVSVVEHGGIKSAQVRSHAGRWFLRCVYPFPGNEGQIGGAIITFADVTELRKTQDELRLANWIAGQNEAFRSFLNGDALEISLGILTRTLLSQFAEGVRCGLYLADSFGKTLHHLTGMSDAYVKCVDGFKIGPDSLACGLAVHAGHPVITRDVMKDDRWQPWLWLANDFAYRGCWSFPIEGSSGTIIGTLAVYHPEPASPTERDMELVNSITRTAAIIITGDHHAAKTARDS